MLKVIIKVTDVAEYNEYDELVKELDSPKVKTTQSIIDEKELAEHLDNDEITAFVKSTDVANVIGVADWVGDEDGEIEHAHSELAEDEIYVITRSGGGEVLKLAKGSYTYNHEYQNYGLDEPFDEAETLITWEQY